MSDHPDHLMQLEPSQDAGAAGCCRASRCFSPPGPSVADLHRRCIALEDERRRLASEIADRRGGETAEGRQLIEREWAVIREIGNLLELSRQPLHVPSMTLPPWSILPSISSLTRRHPISFCRTGRGRSTYSAPCATSRRMSRSPGCATVNSRCRPRSRNLSPVPGGE